MRESVALQQLCIENWLFEEGFVDIPEFSQFFFLCRGSKLTLLLAKVVDDIDMIFTGHPEALKQFQKSISAKCDVARLSSESNIVFTGLFIR